MSARATRTCLALAFCLFATAPGAPGASAPPGEDLARLRQRLEALKNELAQSEESRGEAVDALRESEQAISEANRRIYELDRSQRDVQAALAKLKSRGGSLESTIAGQQGALSRLLYRQYVAGQADPLRLALNHQDPNAIARDLHYLTYVQKARADLIGRLRTDLDALKSLTAESLQKSAELAAIQKESVTQRKLLEKEKAARKEVLGRISRTVERQRRQIGTLERDEKRLTRLVASLGRLLDSRKPKPGPTSGPRSERLPDASTGGTPFGQLRGRLSLPVRGELAGRFGSPRADSGLSWKGLFIATAAGETVRAVAEGRVVFADWLRGFGNLLIVDHGNGYMSLYGNNETLIRRVGDSVRGGDTVATVGDSGGNAQTGLYFELRHQGKPFDPLGWVTLR